MRDYAGLKTVLLDDLGLSGDTGGPIVSDNSSHYVARRSLADSFLKKLCPTGDSRGADLAALIKFKAINDQLSDSYGFSAQSESESCFFDYFRDEVRKVLDLDSDGRGFGLDYLRESMMVGPGSAQKADSRCMYTKLFESSISYTNPHLIPIYRAALSETGFWADAEMQRFLKYGFERVRGGVLFFAPKNAEISRTCCTEPSLNMLFQKAIGSFLEERLGKHFGIYLKSQPALNRELARIGSVDGSYATIDLTSASDSIGLSLMEQVLPESKLKAWMMMSRSEKAILPDGSEVTLRMISTMGNGFTFPLQTIIFACAVRAVYQVMGYPHTECQTPNFSVFGDDIIVRTRTYDFVVRMLEKLGFMVNVRKSFNTGAFRESCGHDYFSGINVRGVYIKSLETHQQVYSAINRLTRWSSYHSVPLVRTLKLLISWVRDIRIPPSEADDAGIKVPFDMTKPILTPSYWFKYRYFKRRLTRLPFVEPDADDSTLNQSGMAVCFLAGHFRRRDLILQTEQDSAWKHDWSISVSLRDRVGVRSRYKIATNSIPFWDYLPDSMMANDSHEVGSSDAADSSRDEDGTWRLPLTRESYGSWKAVVAAALG